MDGWIVLWRAVSVSEHDQLARTRCFECTPASVEGKHLATTRDDAVAWGRLLMQAGFRIVRVLLRAEDVAKLWYWERLDGVGPAYCGELDQLINAIIELE